MTNPFNKATNAPKVDLDSAEAYDPDLGDGEGVIEVVQCETYDAGYGLNFAATVKVISSDNPADQAETKRRVRLTGLEDTDMKGGKKKRARLREFLAASVGVSPTQESPDGKHSWSEFMDEVTEEDGTGLAGQQLQFKRVTVPAKTEGWSPSVRYSFSALAAS